MDIKKLNVSYATMKTIAFGKIPVYWINQSDGSYWLYSITDEHQLYAKALADENGEETEGTDAKDFADNYKDADSEVESEEDALAKGYYINNENALVTPRDHSGKLLFTPTPHTYGLHTFVTEFFDDLGPPLVRGAGDRIQIVFTDSATNSVEGKFGEIFELSKGEAYLTGTWDSSDIMTVGVIIPATSYNAVGTGGNANIVNPPGIIVPAAGDGALEVDLSTACPVPAGRAKDGYWDVDFFSGVITPSLTPGKAKWHLVPADIEATYVKISMGDPSGLIMIRTEGAEYIHNTHKLKFTCIKNSSGAGEINIRLYVYRENVG